MTVDFLLTSFVVVLSPGTGVLYTVGIGLTRGAYPSVIAALGCTLGILPHLCAVILGLAALLEASPIMLQVFKLVGVGYLFYMAWGTLRADGALSFETNEVGTSSGRIVLSAVLINILNPKLAIFFLAFLPLFVDGDSARPLTDMIVLSGVFMLMTFIVLGGYGLISARLGSSYLLTPQSAPWLQRAFAVAFAAMGLKLLLSQI